MANAAHESLGRVTNPSPSSAGQGGAVRRAGKDDVADRILDRLRDQLNG